MEGSEEWEKGRVEGTERVAGERKQGINLFNT